MRYRHYLLIPAAISLVCMVATFSNRLPQVIGYYPDEQAHAYLLAAITFLAMWTALEVTASILRARLPRCPACGYRFAGRCPECGHEA